MYRISRRRGGEGRGGLLARANNWEDTSYYFNYFVRYIIHRYCAQLALFVFGFSIRLSCKPQKSRSGGGGVRTTRYSTRGSYPEPCIIRGGTSKLGKACLATPSPASPPACLPVCAPGCVSAPLFWIVSLTLTLTQTLVRSFKPGKYIANNMSSGNEIRVCLHHTS